MEVAGESWHSGQQDLWSGPRWFPRQSGPRAEGVPAGGSARCLLEKARHRHSSSKSSFHRALLGTDSIHGWLIARVRFMPSMLVPG